MYVTYAISMTFPSFLQLFSSVSPLCPQQLFKVGAVKLLIHCCYTLIRILKFTAGSCQTCFSHNGEVVTRYYCRAEAEVARNNVTGQHISCINYQNIKYVKNILRCSGLNLLDWTVIVCWTL